MAPLSERPATSLPSWIDSGSRNTRRRPSLTVSTWTAVSVIGVSFSASARGGGPNGGQVGQAIAQPPSKAKARMRYIIRPRKRRRILMLGECGHNLRRGAVVRFPRWVWHDGDGAQ